MNKILKIISVIERRCICLLDGISNKLFTDLYWRYLKRQGVKFGGRPNYIAASAYLDGQGLNIISIGADTVISREAMLLTHDYSVETMLHSIGRGTENRFIHVNEPISIGSNSFIGARASLLPGSSVGDNCIIGACAVVKGHIPDNSVAVGCPARVIKKTTEAGASVAKAMGFPLDLNPEKQNERKDG